MTNPIDDLLELADRLRGYEQKYNRSSADFYRDFQAGTLDDELQHHTEWAAVYDLFVKTKRVIEATLMRHVGDLVVEAEAPDLTDVLREIDAIIYPA